GVPWAVDVRVVALLGLVLDVRDRDGDTALALLGRLVDLVERRRLVEVGVLVVQNLGDGRRQRGLAVVDVTDRADVDVRLGPLELRLRHCRVLLDWFLLVRRADGRVWGDAVRAADGTRPRLAAITRPWPWR